MSANDTARLIRRLELLRALHEFDAETQAELSDSTYWNESVSVSHVECWGVEAELTMRATEGDAAAIAWLHRTEPKSEPPAIRAPYHDPDDIP